METEQQEVQGQRLVSVLYSAHRDLYQVPAMSKNCWLSVQVFTLPMSESFVFAQRREYLGPMLTADGKAWRRSYSTEWVVVQPGTFATLPADDPMVLDYAVIAK